MESLTNEVRRIVTSPYAVSLKNLHDILRDVDPHALQRWAYGNECYIDALAAAVLEGLQLWLYTLDIVRDLSCIVSFRDALLLQKPLLLDTLLKKGVMSPDNGTQYASVCLAMLAAPLPAKVPAPASLPSFFRTRLELAVEAPSAATIRPVYSLLAGVGPGLLDILPVEATSRFHEQLGRMLQSLDDRPAILLCLAILARAVSSLSPVYRTTETPSPHQDSTLQSEGVLPDEAGRYDNIRKYFNARRASKTLDLVVLRAIEACSRSFALNCCEAVESLSLAQEIVRVVDSAERVGWLKKSVPKTRKLFQKVLRKDINVEVQLAALEFIVSLVEVDQIPNEIVMSFQDISGMQLAKPPSIGAVEKYASRLDEDFVTTELLESLRLTTLHNHYDREVLRALKMATSVVSGLSSAVPGSQKLRQMILYALSSNRFSEPLARFQSHRLPLRRGSPSHEHHDICSIRFANLQRSLSQTLCSLFIKTALLAGREEISIDTSIAGALIDKQVAMAGPQETCQIGFSHLAGKTGGISLSEANSWPAVTTASHDWKARLADELCRDASHRHDSVVRIVSEVCRDLEARCEIAEQPLLEEQARSTDLRNRLETSEKKLAELKNQQQERALILSGMETERNRFADQVQAAEQRLRDLSKGLEEVHQQFDQAKQEAKLATEAAQETAKQRKLEHLATTTARDETIEEQDAQIRIVEANAQVLEEEVEDLRSQILDSQRLIARLQNLIDERTIEVAELKACAVSNETELDRLRTAESRLEADKQALQSELHEATTQHESLTLQHQDRCAKLEKEKSQLQRDHENYISQKTGEIAKQQLTHEHEIHALQAELAQASRAAAFYARKQSATISELQRKLDLQSEEREERARDFAQVQELSSKLMAVMGAKSGQPPVFHKGTVGLKGVEISSDNPVLEEADYCNSGTEFTQPMRSNASSRSVPTPKWTKPRRSFQTPFRQQPRINVGSKSVKSTHGTRSKVRRQPLKDLGVSTKIQRKLTPSGPGQEADERHVGLVDCDMNNENNPALREVDFGDLSFGGSDIFTSTAKGETQVLRSRIPKDTYDETTADF